MQAEKRLYDTIQKNKLITRHQVIKLSYEADVKGGYKQQRGRKLHQFVENN